MLNAQDVKSAPMEIPDYFKGEGGIKIIPETIDFVETGTFLDAKDTFLTFKLKHDRTGVLKNDLGFKAGGSYFLDGKQTIAAGTLMYAVNYGYAIDPKTNRTVGGLGWCAIRVEKSSPLCIFWDGTKRPNFNKKLNEPITTASYVESRSYQSQFYQPTLRDTIVEGGTIPIIEERDVDFGRDLTVEIKFKKFKRGKASLYGQFSDGEAVVKYVGMDKLLSDLKLNSEGEASFDLFGRTLTFTKIENKKAKFELSGPKSR